MQVLLNLARLSWLPLRSNDGSGMLVDFRSWLRSTFLALSMAVAVHSIWQSLTQALQQDR